VNTKVFLFTEDSGKHAAEVLQALVKKLLQQLSPGLPTNLLPLKTAAPSAEATAAWQGHYWRKRYSPLHRALVSELATRVSTGDIVLLHHDHDVAYGQPSDLAAQVDGLLDDVRIELSRRPTPATWRGAILTLTPCYSVESWLYHNHGAVEALPVHKRNAALRWLRGNLHATLGYDHIYMPKDTSPLKDDHNLTLATKAFPADLAAARSPSWQATQTRLSASPPLKALLSAINPP
jgi:hypothetical protein